MNHYKTTAKNYLYVPMILLLAFTSIYKPLIAQDNPTELAQPIVDEGKLLYRLEMASWIGTDLFLDKYKSTQNIGGYFSYIEEDFTVCIFFSNENSPRVIGTLKFDKTFKPRKANVNLEPRTFTSEENNIYEIRKTALYEIEHDTFFKRYKNTSLNVIPIITENSRKVYVLTAPKQGGIVIFGNDYFMTFNSANELESKKCLHANIIFIEYGSDIKTKDGGSVVGSVHNHSIETGSYITSTDICTLMLYSKFAKWKSHQVVSKEYLNIWDCETEKLLVINRNQLFKK